MPDNDNTIGGAARAGELLTNPPQPPDGESSDNLVPKLVAKDAVAAVDVTNDTVEVAGTDVTLGRMGDVNAVETLSFEPLVVTRLGGTLPWDTTSKQLQCGETVTDKNGDMNFRLVYECVCTLTQLERLQQMRSLQTTITLISRFYTGPVTFDELRVDRIPDANGAIRRGAANTDEPLYEVQLQSKEESQ